VRDYVDEVRNPVKSECERVDQGGSKRPRVISANCLPPERLVLVPISEAAAIDQRGVFVPHVTHEHQILGAEVLIVPADVLVAIEGR
jgi:hypothetical protein